MLDDTLIMGDYQFTASRHQDNLAGLMQCDIFYQTSTIESVFIRSFYFDEITSQNIETFCQQFANDEQYRQQTLDRTTDWATSNDLFLRNSANPYFQANPARQQIGSLVSTYYFFRDHAKCIINLPEYQTIQKYDTSVKPHPHQPDPKIAPMIDQLNQVDGMQTLASCQGVSGVVYYNNVEIMTVSPHARYAYIWFMTVPSDFEAYFSNTKYIHFTDDIYPTLQSTGDNSAFLETLQKILNSNF